MMRHGLLGLVLLGCTAAATAAPLSVEAYADEGLAVLLRTQDETYAVDHRNLQLTDAGVNIWLQTDFEKPRPTFQSPRAHVRNIARAEVDCLQHRYRFSQIRFFGAEGELVNSMDQKTAWTEPKLSSVGESLIRDICLGYVPTADQQRLAAEPQQPLLPESLAARTQAAQPALP